MRQLLLVVTSLLAGFAGGLLGVRVALTHRPPQPDQLVRARSFELVDQAGQPISYWGVDHNGDAVLAFGSHWPSSPGKGPRSDHSAPNLRDLNGQRAAIGVIDDDPFLRLRGADGKTRIRMYLSDYAKPILLMEDKSGPRISLGIEQSDMPGPNDDDWALDFGPDSRARIGTYTEKAAGQTYVRGIFSVKEQRLKYPYEQK